MYGPRPSPSVLISLQITLFGQSAGSISIGHLLLSAGLENYGVRGVVSVGHPSILLYSAQAFRGLPNQIMESGSAGSIPLFNASRRDLLWDAFTANVSTCTGVLRGSTFPSLRNASTAELLGSWEAAVNVFPDTFLFVPVLDGPDGLIPELPSTLFAAGHIPKIPFIAGTVLDEGTAFVQQTLSSTYDLFDFFQAAAMPYPQEFSAQFAEAIQVLVIQYYDDPTLGSPFGTGALYKSTAAAFGDIAFQAPRREWIQAAAAAGVPAYGYIFTDQNAAAAEPSLGGVYRSRACLIGFTMWLTLFRSFAVHHGSEVPYVYGFSSVGAVSPESGLISQAMMDYWLSFAVSGTPNDGKGLTSACCVLPSSLTFSD